MTARLVENMDFASYLAHHALSASGMKHLLDSPARFQWERDNPSDSPAMLLGRLIHAIAFDQPHDFIVKDWNAASNVGKARRDEVLAEHGVDSVDALAIVSADDWTVAEGIAKALRTNRLAHSVLFRPLVKHEVSAFWTDDETGVELKCRYDALGHDWRIGDLKSTRKARPETFVRDAAAFGYFTSAAQYVAGAAAFDAAAEYILVAVEKTRPHFISVVGINDMDLELGERLRRKAIRRYAECVERDEWPGYDGEIAYPEAPSWWRYQAEEATEVEMTF